MSFVTMILGRESKGMSYEAQRQAIDRWSAHKPVTFNEFVNLPKEKQEAGE